MIEVAKLVKKFGPCEAVRNISFNVEKGTIWGFLGPNGAGKTTTMRMLTGYLPPTEGDVHINGIDVNTNPLKIKRIVGYLPESVPLYPELTVREYLRFVAELAGIEKKKIGYAVDRVVSKTNLTEVFPRLVRNLSRGYRQRLGIAQAIIHEPEVLILDEPTIGLDPAQIIEIREMINSFRESATVILSSHILAEITQVCDGAVIIKDGRLMAYLNRDEWKKHLEIMAGNTGSLSAGQIRQAFPGINEAVIRNDSIKLEYRELIDDINPLLSYLINSGVQIREVKSGLEGLYMKIISSEEGRIQ